MADETKTNPKSPETEPETAPEPSITLAEFGRRYAWVEVEEGVRRPAREMMAGFVHEETAAEHRVGKVADFQARWEAFRRRKA